MRNDLLKPDSSAKNFMFQFIYNAVTLVIPLIVSPYLTIALGSTSLGIYTYTYSIAYYFVVIAKLGIEKHGQRIIAQKRDDITSLRKTFWSLYAIHAVFSLISLLAYIAYVMMICKSNVRIAYIQIIYVVSALFDITWLFYGLEKFKSVAIRNAVVKILETACIFCFVKSPSDIGTYTLIMYISVCVVQLIMMPQVIKAIPPISFKWADMKEHIKPLFTLFAAVIAVTLYTVFDKTLPGLLSTAENVAFYQYSNQIVQVPETFITAIGKVLYPRACKEAKDQNLNGMNSTREMATLFIFAIGFASIFGLLSVSELFATLYYGQDFAVCGKVIMSMIPLILIIGLGDMVRSTCIYPFKKDSAMVKILFANATANLIISSILIPVIGIYGAVIGTIAAESTWLIAELFLSRHYFSIKTIVRDGTPFLIIGGIMYLAVRGIVSITSNSVDGLIIQIAAGTVIYVTLSLIYARFFNAQTHAMPQSLFSKVKRHWQIIKH